MRQRFFWQRIWTGSSDSLQWFFRKSIFLPEGITIVFLLMAELVCLLTFVRSSVVILFFKWLLTCIWIFFPSFHIDTSPMTFLLFWEVVAYLFGLVAFPWLAVRLSQNIIIEWRIHKQLAAWNVDYAVRRGTALLSSLRIEAQFEQEKRRIWKISHYDPLSSQVIDLPSQSKLSPLAGPASFFYFLFSFYLHLPHDEHQELVEGSLANTLTTQANELWASSSEPFLLPSALPKRLIFLFDEPRICLVGSDDITLRVKHPRQRELLAYLAVSARERPVERSTIINAVYEGRSEKNDWLEKHQESLSNDVKALRGFIKAASEGKGIPYIDPIHVDTHGPHAVWKLHDAYEVVDVTRIDNLEQQLNRLRHEERKSLQEAEGLREAYTTMIKGYAKGFLGQLITDEQVGKWATPYHTKYRIKYRQILWDLAQYESELGEAVQGENQRKSFRRSADLYKEYAFLTLPRDESEWERGEQAKLSEQALQQCMMMYSKMSDVLALRRVYHEYVDRMKRRIPTWEVDPQTQKLLVDRDQDILPSH